MFNGYSASDSYELRSPENILNPNRGQTWLPLVTYHARVLYCRSCKLDIVVQRKKLQITILYRTYRTVVRSCNLRETLPPPCRLCMIQAFCPVGILAEDSHRTAEHSNVQLTATPHPLASSLSLLRSAAAAHWRSLHQFPSPALLSLQPRVTCVTSTVRDCSYVDGRVCLTHSIH